MKQSCFLKEFSLKGDICYAVLITNEVADE